ncbi:MAG: hypothetical protein P8Y09_11775, partial [Deltaproteobacteria bacterium]
MILVSPAPGVPPAYSCLKLVGPCDPPSLTLPASPARGRGFSYSSPISGEGIFVLLPISGEGIFLLLPHQGATTSHTGGMARR